MWNDQLRALVAAIQKAERVYIAGNGGSAANAIHIANDLVSVGIKAHALTADISTLTAIANDYGYEEIFSKQLETFATERDLLIVLSGSGTSPNILVALAKARDLNLPSIAIVGAFSRIITAEGLAGITITTGHDMQAAEEAQLEITHEVMRRLRTSPT